MSIFTRTARNWVIAALMLISLGAACEYYFYRYTRTEPIDSPIVQAFLVDDDGQRPHEVFGPNSNPEPVADTRFQALHGLVDAEARRVVERAGLSCELSRTNALSLRCVREFYTVAGPGSWNLDLHLDDNKRVVSLTATRWGHFPHY